MKNELKTLWEKEEQAAFQGWDFSHLDNRWELGKLPWDYKSIIFNYLKSDSILLDMGTGGGEFLLKLKHPYNKTYVTEGYAPNIELCNKKLKPLGIGVESVVDDKNILFKDNMFDIIINRHESYDVGQVKRLLKPGGIFITQQVGDQNSVSLAKALIDNCENESEWDANYAINSLEDNDFKILYNNESLSYYRFFDVGAIVYFAKIIKWEFPNFSVKKHLDKLMCLHDMILKDGYIKSEKHRFIIVSKNQK